MACFDPTPSPCVGVAEPPPEVHVAAPVEPFIDTSDLSVLVRAFHGAEAPSVEAPTWVKSAQLTISRSKADDFQDRQIYLFVDDEPWARFGTAPSSLASTSG